MEQLLPRAAEFIGAAGLAAWIYLTFFRGGFWRVHAPPGVPCSNLKKKIVVLIPARDEAAVIRESVTSLLQQNYSGEIQIRVIDDHSSDGTGKAVLEAARLTSGSDRVGVLSSRPLPSGWTGKMWALSEGFEQAESLNPDYFLLTDADILHSSENVAQLVARAESHNLDMVSLMVRLRCESWAERSIIPAFVFFFFMLYPPAWVAKAKNRTAAAAGGCILIRPKALAAIGGIQAIRGELIDDCALAARVKNGGGSIWLGVTTKTQSLRAYPSMCDLERMIARTAFTQLRHSAILLVATLTAMTVIFLAPPLLLFSSPETAWMAASSYLLMCICFWPSLRLYKRPLWTAPMLPMIALFYVAATIHSAISYWQGRGGVWKGRIQDSAAVRAE